MRTTLYMASIIGYAFLAASAPVDNGNLEGLVPGTLVSKSVGVLSPRQATSLTNCIIAIFDDENTADFQQLVSCHNTFVSEGDRTEQLRLAFNLYDVDRDGFITNAELFNLLKSVAGSVATDEQIQQPVNSAMSAADLDGDGRISFDEFSALAA